MILVTGGAGYIGSHTVVELIQQGAEVVIVDNFSNSSKNSLDAIAKITGIKVPFIEYDITDWRGVLPLLSAYKIDQIIHFAAYKSVGESVAEPLKYYDNNLGSLTGVLHVAQELGVKNFVFSSSCTVYGAPKEIPVDETSPAQNAMSPYGATKVISEQILQDYYVSCGEDVSISVLRYFNPIGAHESGLIGDAPSGIPNNLLPYLTQAVDGVLKELKVFGDDYDTPDGTCLRDYIHVVDLADAHIKALSYISKKRGFHVFNIGTNKASSVLDIIQTFEQVNGVKVPYCITERRPGDVPAVYSNSSKAKKELGWEAKLDLGDMLKSAWKFQKVGK